MAKDPDKKAPTKHDEQPPKSDAEPQAKEQAAEKPALLPESGHSAGPGAEHQSEHAP